MLLSRPLNITLKSLTRIFYVFTLLEATTTLITKNNGCLLYLIKVYCTFTSSLVMCILFVYSNPKPPKGGYRLIIASNRDEFYSRPAKPAFLCPKTGIIGGRDMEPGREGGMWLGLSLKEAKIKFGCLLNVKGGTTNKPANAGRGPLVRDYLECKQTALDYLKNIQAYQYSPHNLFMLEISKSDSFAYHSSNCPEETFEYPGRQVLVFGNSCPGAPLSKVTNGKVLFEKIIQEQNSKEKLVEQLLGLLKCEMKWLPDKELQWRDPEHYEMLSAIYVHIGNKFGTRTHSVILIDEAGNIEFIEHTMKEPINSEHPQWEVNVIQAVL